MLSIPHTFINEDENYITIPALKRFAKEKRNEDLKTAIDRPQLIEEIKNYASQSAEREEIVLDWLDHVLAEGIKDVQIRFLNDEYSYAFLYDDLYLHGILDPLLVDDKNSHLCGKYSENLDLFRYDIIADDYGRRIKFYFGKLLCSFSKERGSSIIPYPIYAELFLDQGLFVTRAKSKAGLYKYMSEFVLEEAYPTTAEKQMLDTVKYVCDLFSLKTLRGFEASEKFKQHLYRMLERYTQTPTPIVELMDAKIAESDQIIEKLMKDICVLPEGYREDVRADIFNTVEKYFSISFPDKKVFTQDREAYPLKLNATDEEDSQVQQVAALEQPLQSKAIFFDNKKMLQKSQSCDGVLFMFKRLNTLYCSKQFKVNFEIRNKKDYCTLKFTEYTMEEDIIHVLFSFIGTAGIAK